MRIRSVAAATLSTALLLGTVVPASAQDDPYQLLTEAVTTTASATSFHVLVEANGTLNLGESMGNVPFAIDGTRAEGDVSIDPPSASLSFDVPLQGLAITGGLIVPGDGNAYVKLTLPIGSADDLWHIIPIGAIDVPETLASPPPTADLAAELRTELDSAGVVITNEGETTCAAGTCARLHLEVPPSALQGDMGPLSGLSDILPGASPAPSAAAAAPIPVDILVDTATKRLDSVRVTIADEATGTEMTLVVTMSGYDAPVTVAPPPADQTTTEPLLGGLGG
jgi:hypothetical protein